MQKLFFITLQYVLPHHLLSRFAGWLANSNRVWLKNYLINWFINKYPVDMKEAVIEDPFAYATYNEFFTRTLKPALRPIAQDKSFIISPADGTIAQIGNINNTQLIQAKNHYFDLRSLLGGDDELAAQFIDGTFTTIYLAPYNYHRVHLPMDGRLIKTIYIPGKLFSVNQTTSEYIPNLYSRNERLVAIYQTEIGPMAVILVGAMIVGSIKTAWQDQAISHERIITTPFQTPIPYHKGDEVGRFELGSTVILLFPKHKMTWLANMTANQTVKYGEAIGKID